MYRKLREWHQLFGTQVEILLFPSDEFGRQELPTNKIPEFVAAAEQSKTGGKEEDDGFVSREKHDGVMQVRATAARLANALRTPCERLRAPC